VLTEPSVSVREPYVGPRPFERDDASIFFGRDQEVEDVLSLVVAHRTFLLYAASGAGKSSLLNAGLIPRLESEGFDVLPPARVLGAADVAADEVETNVYLAGLLSHWEQDEERDRPTSLRAFLEARPRGEDDEGFPEPRALIIDQFEEVFTLHPARWPERAPFFDEIREALEADPLLRVVIAIREDYIAHLDPYAARLPEALRSRFRLERLRRGPAIAAVQGPLRATGRTLAEGVAEALVDDLLTTSIETRSGRTEKVRGEFVEPVHLQVACQSLWSRLAPDVSEITETELRIHGNLDQVLREFYGDAVHEAVRASRAREPRVRSWVERTLITPGGTRGTVYSEARTTAGLPNTAVRALAEKRLIRSEWRANAHWYELTHDRLIEPIRASNREYFSRRSRDRLRRVVGGFTALVGLLAGVIGLLYTTVPAIAPQRQAAAISVGQPALNTSFGDYLSATDQPRLGFSSDALGRTGNNYTLALRIQGFEGARLTLRWRLVQEGTGKVVARERALDVEPSAELLEAQHAVWVPQPAQPGRYSVVFDVAASAGRVLARVSSTPFEVSEGVSVVACTRVGTSARNLITGTPGPDVLCGRGGSDVLLGLQGDDVLDGGAGRDRLQGGPGDDEFRAQDREPDVVRGGDGTDDGSFDAMDKLTGVEVLRRRLLPSAQGRFRSVGRASSGTARG